MRKLIIVVLLLLCGCAKEEIKPDPKVIPIKTFQIKDTPDTGVYYPI